MNDRDPMHPSAEEIQALLEGDLPAGGPERLRIEEHVAVCARCAAEVDAWRTLFADLHELAAVPLPSPSPGFADRVLRELRLPASAAEPVPTPVAEPERGWLRRLVPARSRHLSGDVLQDLADGVLAGRRAARARAHLAACATCTAELATWRGMMDALARAPRFAPAESFADRVVSALALRPAAQGAALVRPAAAETALWSRALVLARRAVSRVTPRSRRAWAAISGIAVTPAAIFGLMLWVVFSHPTLTPGALVSFAAWQISDLAAAAWSAVVAGGASLVSLAGVDAIAQGLTTLVQSPLVLAGGAVLYAASAALALRVLHKNLIVPRRYARASSR